MLSGTTGGKVFHDVNGNGSFDGGDVALASIDVIVTDSLGVAQTVVTDASGNWNRHRAARSDQHQRGSNRSAVLGDLRHRLLADRGNRPNTITAVSSVNTVAGDDGFRLASVPIALLLNITVMLIVRGILNGEELAWRGSALPQLQSKYNALVSSVILSVPFTLFHLPLFFDPAMNMGPFTSFAIRAVALTILFTWIYDNTHGSVLLAYFMHAAFNTWTNVFSIETADNHFQDWMMTVVMVIVAAIVVAVSGTENLSRTNTRIQE